MKPKAFILIDAMSLERNKALVEYIGMYKREIQVLEVGRCWSSAGRMVTLGAG